MKNTFASGLSFNAESIQATIQRALASAGIDTTSGPMRDVTETVRRALSPHEPEAGEPRPLAEESPSRGSFETLQFGNAAGSRAYKLYVPTRSAESAMPMVVMLHGCTQSADDFAAGTRMNCLADEHGFLVLYPQQGAGANPSKCWNWFQGKDQLRDSGEPSLISGMVREVAARHGVDPRRIFVAGLSAGAAMAVILGETYPDLFAGVGAHSGLPYGSATDVVSAMAARKGGRGSSGGGLPGLHTQAAGRVRHAVPLIVFHGDRDHTVQHSNGVEIVQQASEVHAAGMTLTASTQLATSPGGRRYTRTVHADEAGRPFIESWTLHGAGHAWSGGDPAGSYTDGAGPCASQEMVRFFLALPRAGAA